MIRPTLDAETYDRLLDITGGDLEFLDELVATYLDDAVVQLEALRAAGAAGDPEAVVRPAHTLKSSSASIGAIDLAERCRELEADARTGAIPDLSDRVTACETSFSDAREALLAIRAAR